MKKIGPSPGVVCGISILALVMAQAGCAEEPRHRDGDGGAGGEGEGSAGTTSSGASSGGQGGGGGQSPVEGVWEAFDSGLGELDLTAIWGSGPNDIWVTGVDKDGANGRAAHWDGTAWTDVLSSGSSAGLYDVYGFGPNDVWFVGEATMGIVRIHWDGASFTHVGESSGALGLEGVWGASSNDVWMVGAGTLEHWDGSTLKPYTAGGAVLSDAWGGSSGPVWVIGKEGSIMRLENGQLTVEYEFPDFLTSTAAIWGTAANDIWAVSDEFTAHYDGTTWLNVDNGTQAVLSGVWGSSSNSFWAVGNLDTVLHFDGAAWSPVSTGTMFHWNAVWGADAKTIWLAGANGALMRGTLK